MHRTDEQMKEDAAWGAAYHSPSDAFKDPAFRASKPETQRWALKELDKKGWGTKSDQEIDAFIERMKPNWEREDQKAKIVTQQMAQLPPQGPPPEDVKKAEKKSMFQKAVAPITAGVGQAMELATTPAVPLARLLQGEGLESFNPRGMVNTLGQGGVAKQSRETAAAGVVPQTPWQAGAMGAQFVPGVGPLAKAGMIPRVAKSALAAGGLQGLLGEQGLVEGGSVGEAASEAGFGALKGGATQGVGEALGKMAGGARQLPFTGAAKRAGAKDYKNVSKTVSEISPELQPGKTQQAGGEYFTGTKGAKKAAEGEFGSRLTALEAELNRVQGNPYIRSQKLLDVWKGIKKQWGKDPALEDQLVAMAPTQRGEFLPQQAADIIKFTGQRLAPDATGVGHMKNAAMDDLVNAVEASLPASAKGMLTGAREQYARSSGLQELLSPAFKPGSGYTFDIKKVQEALSTDPDFLARLGKSELEKLFLAVTRGASKGPGFMDKPAGNVSVPYPTQTGAMVAALRNMLTKGSTVGQHPLALKPGTKAGMGVATTAASSVANRARREE